MDNLAKEIRCVRQPGQMQQALVYKKGDGSDDLSDSSGTSRQSAPSKLSYGFNYAAHYQGQNLPLLKLPQISGGIQSVSLNCIKELKSQVWDLQQHLSEARTENKLLKRIQNRHMVALRRFQDIEGSLPQIFTKHDNEVRALQEQLRKTRNIRDCLTRQQQATERKLQNTMAALHHLQLLSQDHSLLEREKLTCMLTKATAALEEKDKRTQDLEKHLKLCEASFKRQLVTEQRKLSKERKITFYLQEQTHQLTLKIQDRERKLEKHNIYSNRFRKGFSKKGSESEIVKADTQILLLEPEISETEVRLEEEDKQAKAVNLFCCSPVQESLEIENPEDPANITSEENHTEHTEIYKDSSEQNSLEKSPEHQTEGECTEEEEASELLEAPLMLEEEQKTEEHEREAYNISEKSVNSTDPSRKGLELSKIKHHSLQLQNLMTFSSSFSISNHSSHNLGVQDGQASFNCQLVTEQRKLSEERKISFYLQEQTHQLTQKIQDRERKLEKHNIYSNRFRKGFSKKGSESEIVKADTQILLLEPEISETEVRLEEEDKQAKAVNLFCCSPVQESLEIENPEDPANITSEENRTEHTEIYKDSSEQNSLEKSPEHQTEGECTEEEEASELLEAPLMLEEEQKTEEHESKAYNISKKSVNSTDPTRKGRKLPKIKRHYTFKQTIENMHRGIPAYSHLNMSPRESTRILTKVEALSSTICEVTELSPPWESSSPQ